MNPERTVKWFLQELQAYFALAARAVVRIFRRPFYYREFVTQLDKMGVGSLFIVCLTGLFTGMVMALQALIQLKPFAATSYVGGMVAVTMVKELGPVLSSLMVAGRVGSAITAELGTMVVTEQVDAMRVEGTDVITRLATSRLKAMLVAMPLLAVITDALALLGGFVIASGYDINILMYWKSLSQFLVFQDIIEGVAKPFVFGFLIATIGCYVGLNTKGGAEGVGAAAKRAVVVTSIMVLVCDFFMTKIFIVFR
ncbi:MlaE family ABC transporter permease [Geobacter benzoatilyticus]|jgi:phospholipid/cholesterol/gamma-HCH transport system permease protein|uniref:ABC transporter permease n=1 Tax=Geobacter benzoatilyticus TaxID=2815309 RepID=A0ABX7Q4S5_9BACT|nr:ABC transporter permease [Geobacter benzoatilyticus]QSV45901.1 ABC transporter permease [Geobacter benzoatilyticus]